jgi:hypothetical protein
MAPWSDRILLSKAMAETSNTSKIAQRPDLGPGYRLAAGGRQEVEDDRLSLLERILDPLSHRRRDFVRPGWRCLEVGAGRGSMAVWLAEQVGESGKVVATDIDVTYLERIHLSNLEVRRHNILNDSVDALGHYQPVQGCDCETFVRGRGLGHCGTQVGPHLSGPQTGAPSPLASRL